MAGVDDTEVEECVELYKPAGWVMDHHAAGRKMMMMDRCLRGNQHAVCSEGMTHRISTFVGISSGMQEPLAEKLYKSVLLCFGSDAPHWCVLTGILRHMSVPAGVWLLTL